MVDSNARSSRRTPNDPARIRTIVVDDSRIVRDLVSGMLETHGRFEIVGTADDGEPGVALVRASKPDLVIMDLQMKEMDGSAATRLIKRTDPDTRVIVLTFYAPEAGREIARTADADGFCAKEHLDELPAIAEQLFDR